jgi:type I restriction enzyme S subunit
MTEWQVKKVGDIADTQLGKMLNKGKQSGKYAKPYLRTDNIHWGRIDLTEIKEMDILPEEQDKYLATKGDLLMCEGGASGRTAIWNEDYDISFQNHVHRIRPKDLKEISPKYLLYYFEWFIKNGFASDLIKGVTISSLSQSGLRSIEVTYPSISEQNQIVELLEYHLSRLDAALADVKQAKVKAAQFRMSVLHSVFNSATNTSDWDSTTLEKIGVWKTGSTPLSKNPEFQGDDVKFVTPGDIGFGGKLGSVARTISNQGADSVRRVTPPSVHLVCIGTIGKVAWTNEIVTTNQQINSLEVNAFENNPEFLMWLIASPELQEKLWGNSSSTTVPILNKGKLEKIACSIPSLETQNEVMRFIDISFARLDAVFKTIHLLENHSSILRRSLLQAAFTGQLTKEVVSV